MTSLKMMVVSGVAYVWMRPGLATAQTMIDLQDEAPALLSGAPDVFVADFRAPTWSLKAHDLDAFYDKPHTYTAEPPAAIVVRESDMNLWRSHAWTAAQSGIMRKIFTDYWRAVHWALLQQSIIRRRTAPRWPEPSDDQRLT